MKGTIERSLERLEVLSDESDDPMEHPTCASSARRKATPRMIQG